MINVVEWSLVWEDRGQGWKHHLVCRTVDQEIVQFGNDRKFKSFDEGLVLTTLCGKQYQFDAAGYQRRGGRHMTSGDAADWIRQYWTVGENDLFTHIGYDISVDGDCTEFYHVTLKKPMGQHAKESIFDCASVVASSNGLTVKLQDHCGNSAGDFLVKWVATEITSL